jgi:hypothetical protein
VAAENPAAPPPMMTIAFGCARVSDGRSVGGLRCLLFLAHEDLVAFDLHAPRVECVERRRLQRLSRAQAETGVVPRAMHGVAHHHPSPSGPP